MKKPFFSKFLENQTKSDEVKGGSPLVEATQKYPSDTDEAVTHKYPSDGDDDIYF